MKVTSRLIGRIICWSSLLFRRKLNFLLEHVANHYAKRREYKFFGRYLDFRLEARIID